MNDEHPPLSTTIRVGDYVRQLNYTNWYSVIELRNDAVVVRKWPFDDTDYSMVISHEILNHEWIKGDRKEIEVTSEYTQTGINIMEDKKLHPSGATSSHCPDYAQIPMQAMNALAARFELGEQKHGRDNWRNGLHDKSYVIERLNHCIRHAYHLINKLEGKMAWDGVEDDAGAILWAGAFAAVATEVHFDTSKLPR